MTQLFDPMPTDDTNSILCCYTNSSNHIQVVRSEAVPDWYFERVVFPGQRLLFSAPSVAQLEVYTGILATAILTDHVSCQSLSVQLE